MTQGTWREDTEENKKGLLDAGSALRQTAAIGTEVGLNSILDLLSFIPPAQIGGSAAINLLAQRIRGGKISKGEMIASGLASLIPGGAQSIALGVGKGALSGAIETTGMTTIDEGRFPTAEEFTTGAVVGGSFGGLFSTATGAADIVKDAFNRPSIFNRKVSTKMPGNRVNNILSDKPNRHDSVSVMSGLDGAPEHPVSSFDARPSINTSFNKVVRGLDKNTLEQFDQEELTNYLQAALDYKNMRTQTVVGADGKVLPAKKSVMKGFSYEGNSFITDKNGKKFSLIKTRKPKNTTNRVSEQFNYKLLSESEIDKIILRNSGWDVNVTKPTKDMQELRASLNKLREKHPDEYYRALMEYGDQVYIEHKIQRANDWFWENKEDNPDTFATWLNASSRNEVENLRLLFNDSFKRLKDTSEKIVNKINRKIPEDDLNRFIIDFEDPMSGDFDRRSNPGNLLIRQADSGEILGYIPDYLQELYTKDFSTNFNELLKQTNNPLKSEKIPKFYRLKAGETFSAYRSRILEERVDLIIKEMGNYSTEEIGKAIIQDRNDFFKLFAEDLDWVQVPQWIKDQGLLELTGEHLPITKTSSFRLSEDWKKYLKKTGNEGPGPSLIKKGKVKISKPK